MMKSDLMVGLLYIAAGVAALLAALGAGDRLDGILFGLAGAGIGPGAVMVWRYAYWSAPKNRERYQERLENERIERNDELKEKLRDRAGRYAYLLGLVVVSVSMLAAGVLSALGILGDCRGFVLYLGAFLVVQIAAGMVFFQRLLKKY